MRTHAHIASGYMDIAIILPEAHDALACQACVFLMQLAMSITPVTFMYIVAVNAALNCRCNSRRPYPCARLPSTPAAAVASVRYCRSCRVTAVQRMCASVVDMNALAIVCTLH